MQKKLGDRMSKVYLLLVISYETGGGHGESDAVEGGTRKYNIELVEGLEEKEAKKLIRKSLSKQERKRQENHDKFHGAYH